MDKIAKYREYIQTLLTSYAKDDDDDELQLIFDTQRDHYQWMNVGWQELHRVYRSVMHFDIKDGKIWLQQNLTDQNPAEDLVKWVFLKKILCWGCIHHISVHIQIMVLLRIL